MIHDKRVYNVTTAGSVEELAALLTEHTWTLCTGFELQGYLFLNDSFTEDGAQEYTVVKDDRQVESIRAVLAGEHVDVGPLTPHLNHGKTCPLCR
jgi:hypothetical protein